MVTDQPGVYAGELTSATYGKCILDVSYATFDTPDDADALPEKRYPVGAKLIVTPNVTGPLLGPDSKIILLTSTTLTADDTGHFEFYCIDGNHSTLNPRGWNWNAKLTINGATVGSFNFSPDSTNPDPINLGTFFPLTDAKTGQVLLPGPPPSVEWIGDQLVVGGVIGPHLGVSGSGGGVTSYNDLTDTPTLATVATTGAYTDLTGTPTLFSGSYTDLTNKPSIPAAQVQTDWNATTGLASIANKPALFSGAYTDLTGKPVLSTVATTGSYTDLTNKPTIPAAQVQSDWNAVSGIAQILNKPILFSGAYADLTGKPALFSGSYTDLTNKPTLGTAAAANTTAFATAAQGAKADTALQAASVSTVATTGSYTDLLNKPVIPAAQVQSDWTAVSGLAQILNKPTLFSGSYTDLTNKPTLFSGSYTDLTNKPTIPAAQVQSDWNAVSGMGQILNKPVLGTAAAQNTTAFATAAQGTKADTALQAGALTGYAQTINVVPNTRTVNGKSLSADVTLGASDVGAQPAGSYATAAQGVKADNAIPNPTAPADGNVLSYDTNSTSWKATTLTFGGIQGTGTLAQLAAGSRFTVIYSATTNGGAGGWTYAGSYITARPTARSDIYMDAIDFTGNTAGTGPSFAIAGDAYDVKSA